MQLKLLNFHKIFSQFASNIVGAFIALIIYKSTNSLTFAFLFMVLSMLLRIIITKIFFHLMEKYPQVFLALRIIPFLLYSLALLLLDTQYQVLGICLSVVLYAFSVSFKDIPMELTYSYNASNKGSSSNGFSRLLEYIGVISAIILGGLFLDNLDKWVVILIACLTYLISVIPLFIFYIKQRKTKGFNKEAVSNAIESFKNIKIKKHQQEVISKKLLFRYFMIYFLFCVYDALMSLLSLYLFEVSSSSYSFISYVQAAFYAMFGFGCFVAGKLDEKYDLTLLVGIYCIVSGILVCFVPFLANFIWIEVALFGAIGYLYSHISIFCYSRMMMRCNIMGIGNIALYNRAQAGRWSQCFIYSIASISSVLFVPAFFVIGIIFGSCAIFIPANEEKTRKMLVDYLQNNKLY